MRNDKARKEAERKQRVANHKALHSIIIGNQPVTIFDFNVAGANIDVPFLSKLHYKPIPNIPRANGFMGVLADKAGKCQPIMVTMTNAVAKLFLRKKDGILEPLMDFLRENEFLIKSGKFKVPDISHLSFACYPSTGGRL